MKKYLILIPFIFALLFVLLQFSPEPIKFKNVKDFNNNITYFKDDKTGLCFAIIGINVKNRTDAIGLGFTCVPCEKAEKYLDK